MRQTIPLNLITFLLLSFCIHLNTFAEHENGTLVSRTRIELNDSVIPLAENINEEVKAEQILYTSDGLEIEGYILSPKNIQETPLPTIIFCRGGYKRAFHAFFAVSPEKTG